MTEDKSAIVSQLENLGSSLFQVTEKLAGLDREFADVKSQLGPQLQAVQSFLTDHASVLLGPSPSAGPEVGQINEAVQKLVLCKDQEQILEVFLEETEQHVDRAILFLEKDETYTPWKSMGFPSVTIESVEASHPDDPIVRAARQQRILYRAEGVGEAFPWLGNAGDLPQAAVCIPLVFGDSVPIVFYGDAARGIPLDSLELLSHVTTLVLKNHYLQVLVQEPDRRPGAAAAAAAATAAAGVVASAPPATPTTAPEVEPEAAPRAEPGPEPEPEPEAASTAEPYPAVEPAPEPEEVEEPAADAAPESAEAAPLDASSVTEAPSFEPEVPSFEPEAPAPDAPWFEPETPSFEPETPSFEPETPSFEPETPSFQPETPSFEPETPSFEPEAPSFEPEAPSFEPEAPSFEAEAPADEPEASPFDLEPPPAEPVSEPPPAEPAAESMPPEQEVPAAAPPAEDPLSAAVPVEESPSAPEAAGGEELETHHNEARRFARLLVSEILLYNEEEVEKGRRSNDIYSRLKADIERSRSMYDKRAHEGVKASVDHFHEEVLRILAKGEQESMGGDYPGPQTS